MAEATPERLYLIQLAAGERQVGDQTIAFSMGCYLLRMSDGSHTLIDTGAPPDYDMGVEPRPLLLEQLAGLGVAPEDVNRVIVTHFDPDHVGQNDRFPDAEFVAQRAQYELAKSGHERLGKARAHWDQPGLRYRLVDGDTPLGPGLELIATSGHVPGHQSVLLGLPETGAVLLAIDAVPLERFFTPRGGTAPVDEDPEQTLASTRKLLDLAAREHVALTIFGHDGGQWQRLRLAPEFYG